MTQIEDFGFGALGTGDFPFNPAFDSHKLTPETTNRNDPYPSYAPTRSPPDNRNDPYPSYAPPPPEPERPRPTPYRDQTSSPLPPRRESISLEPEFAQFSFPGFDSLRDGGVKNDVKSSKDFDNFVLHKDEGPSQHPTLYHEDLNKKPHLFTADPYGKHPHHEPEPYHDPYKHEPHHDPYHPEPHHDVYHPEPHHDPYHPEPHHDVYHPEPHHDPYHPEPYHAPHSDYHEPEPYHEPYKPKAPVLLEKRPYEVKEIKALPVALHDTYTNFDCRKAPYPDRHYADPESGCQVFFATVQSLKVNWCRVVFF